MQMYFYICMYISITFICLFPLCIGVIISNPPKPKVTTDDLNLGDFTRTASGGAFIISEVPSGPLPDVFKPAKIIDLCAIFQGQQVLLSWTATGDDLDKGNGRY